MLDHGYDLPLYLQFVIISFVGLILGSFATALTYRIPRNIPWAFNTKKGQESAYHSSCPNCKTPLTPLDLVPFFSWLFLGGKCRHCAEKITTIYPAVELGVLLMCLASLAVWGFTLPLLWIVLASPFLMSLMAIDIEKMILPNQLVLIVFILGLLNHLSSYFLGQRQLDDFLINYALGALLYGGFSWFLGWAVSKVLKKEAMGFGDVKFFAATGMWLGIESLANFCLLSGVLGIMASLIWKIFVSTHLKSSVFPFGPALILSFFILFHLDGSHLLEFILK
ncbi:prepilin peptidase [Alphaproteobacteria bacterium]|nr:prepilin peptidase [Alphaproteobacteria bacterium]